MRVPSEVRFPFASNVNVWLLRAELEAWRRDYNEVRPHSRLGYLTPRDYARALREGTARLAAHANGFAHRALAACHQEGSDQHRLSL